MIYNLLKWKVKSKKKYEGICCVVIIFKVFEYWGFLNENSDSTYEIHSKGKVTRGK